MYNIVFHKCKNITGSAVLLSIDVRSTCFDKLCLTVLLLPLLESLKYKANIFNYPVLFLTPQQLILFQMLSFTLTQKLLF